MELIIWLQENLPTFTQKNLIEQFKNHINANSDNLDDFELEEYYSKQDNLHRDIKQQKTNLDELENQLITNKEELEKEQNDYNLFDSGYGNLMDHSQIVDDKYVDGETTENKHLFNTPFGHLHQGVAIYSFICNDKLCLPFNISINKLII